MIVTFGGLALVSTLLVGTYLSHQLTDDLRQSQQRAMENAATSIAHALRLIIQSRQKDIELLALAPELRGNQGDSTAQTALTQRQQTYREYAWIGLTDHQGTVMQDTGGLLTGKNVAARPWFSAGMAGSYVGDLHTALLLESKLPPLASGEPMRFIDFAAPVVNESGQTIGVVAAHAHWQWLTALVAELLADQSLPDSVDVMVLSNEGQVFYPESEFAQPVMALGFTQASHAVDVPGLDWAVVVRQPLSAFEQPIASIRHRMLVLALVMTVVVALFAAYIASYIAKPAEQLVRNIKLRADDLNPLPSPSSGPTELITLSHSLNRLSSRLHAREIGFQELNESLEQRVQQRTLALNLANQQLSVLASKDR